MRILLYSHDSYGLGHIRRSIEISKQLAQDHPEASQLLITGSMQAALFKLPETLDYIKLPALSKGANGNYRSRKLALSPRQIVALREKIISVSVRKFKPHLILVDKAPAGAQGEMLQTLHDVKARRPKTRIVLGMRDIEDHAPWVRTQWTRHGVYCLLENVYDAILLYGTRAIYDPVAEYRFSRAIEAKMIDCGYITKSDHLLTKERIRGKLRLQTDRLVAVTAGGGEDGFDLIQTYLEMLKSIGRPRFDSVVIRGPLLAPDRRTELKRYQFLPAVKMMDFTPDLLSYLNAADVVVSMGGYNSVCEILSLNRRAIIVPRAKPRMEQLIRAERFAARGLVRMIHPEKLTSRRLLKEIDLAFESKNPISPEAAGLDMDGVENARRAIAQLLGKREALAIND